MKAAKITLIIILWAVLTNAVRMGDTRPLPQVLPFCSGRPAGIYDLAGCAVLFTFFVLLGRSPARGVSTHGLNTQAALSAAKERDDARRRLRPSLALVPLALALAAWILGSIQPAIVWDDILRLLRIPDQDKERFSMLIVLILTCSAILLIKHIVERR